ncbi:site-specific integrase [Bradyrhizobium sp. AUGA SZCCT0182]|uniref:tyrosine-type recombinase/integrase n=1 Tax=Bradyrhizobium sp. AUGA SZCCT0182 TaxID=2807667 RepID=UPI001BAB830A|nr:site-specific integrase [Bradyrhizobium sp. AUGA SZCCT0182]MBR1234596.1 tyrosine-type recombinase/integrase [Bradyrhizobium sp. AUGA SZCCT0182]
MPAAKITDAWVRNLTWAKAVNQYRKGDKPDPKQITFIDTMDRGLALVLVLGAGGTKAFRVMTYVRSKAQSTKIGTYPNLSVKDARNKAREFHRNPDRFKEQAAAAENTFKAVAEEYLRRECGMLRDADGKATFKGGKLRSGAWRRGVLERLVYNAIGDRPIGDIRRSEIVGFLDKIEAGELTNDKRGPIRGGPVMADQTLAIIRKIMNWWAARSDDFRSPIVRGMARTKPKDRARERILTDDELRTVWKTAEDSKGPFERFLQFLLLTAARRTEAAGLTSAELSNDNWTLPSARNKTKVDLVRPLSDEAMRVLSRLPRIVGCDFVFSTDGKSPISGFSKFKKAFDAECGITGWTLHDLRRTARSLMSRAGVPSDHAEICLGHVIAGVRGTYDRYKYHAEKKAAFTALAAQIDRIVYPRENVVEIGSSRS